MTRLSELTDCELVAKSIEYGYRHEISGGKRFACMVDAISREKGKRFWKSYRRPNKNKAREIEACAAAIFHNTN